MSFKYLITEYSADGKTSKGTLNWDSESWIAISGPFDNGTIPTGDYKVVKDGISVKPEKKEMYIKDDQGELGFFIPLVPKFDTPRKGLGIHPDGGPVGTHGCVGIAAADVRNFWSKWMSTAMEQRPTLLNVFVST